jgi:hypothetical protein
MDSTFIQWLVGQAGIGGLAAMALYLLDKAHKDALRREREYAEANREDKKQLLAMLSEIATTMSELKSAIEGVSRERV